jgi:predicted P-loop ATPase
VAAAGRMNNLPERYKHVYFCTSRQGKQSLNKHGHPKAQKSAADALYQKSIFIDIDIEPNNPKHYATHEEAWNEFAALRRKVGLPGPSAVVNSGGGLHIYWLSKTPLLPHEWHPYANGLKQLLLANNFKFDPTCTGDIARILRVPGTSNHKYDPPKEAHLLPLPLKLYDFTVLDFLKQHAGQTPARTARAHQLFDDAADRDSFKAGPAFKIEGEPELQAGIDKFGDSLLEPLPIFKQCGFYREALLNGGKNNDNPQWNLAILGTTFMEDGNNIAHRISKDHPTYTPSDTDAMFDRKVAERRDRGLGYPQCSTIQGAGCASCAMCPLLGKIKSPLNIRPAVTATVNPVGAPVPTKAGTVAVRFRDFNQFGRPKPSLANAVIAIRALGIEASYDLFHNRVNVKNNGKSTTIQEGLLTDHTVSAVRSLINNTFRIDCGDANTFAAIKEIAWDNAFDPVLDLLDECQGNWDGMKRLDTWVIDYLGCEDTRLNRAIGRAVLVAACRRARKPGCKFDFITVLEGPEGINKSTAIRVLAGDEYFSDQSILGASDKEVQEQLEGTWMHESADLAGMRRAEVEQVKAFASRQVDRARPAYGRVREDRPRRSIEWATTNNEEYLLSQTGNRRWWTLKTVKVDIEALKRDREQLLGEAATYEAAGEHIGLDESLWSAARDVQEQRRVTDPWEDALANMDDYLGGVHRSDDGMERVLSIDLLTNVLQIPKPQQTSQHMQRLALAMKHLGWGRGRITIKGVTLRGYVRATPFSVAQRLAHSKMGIEESPPEPVSTGICTSP